MKTFRLLLMACMPLLFAACNKDECSVQKEVIKYTPIYKPMADLRTVQTLPAKAIVANGKIFSKGNVIYVNEVNKGFHVINNSNPSNPTTTAFIQVPGNLDMVGYGNYLIVDNYVDLLTFDISNPLAPQLVSRKQNALPLRQYNYGFADDSTKGMIVDFEKTKTTEKVECNQNEWLRSGFLFSVSNIAQSSLFGTKAATSGNGQTGSLSRFAINNNHLYVANRNSITPVDINNPLNPLVKTKVPTGEIETSYAFNNHLLIGAPSGMFIYSLSNPDVPTFLSSFSHWRGCDPVVAQGNYAYVTVRGGGPCGGAANTLSVIDVTDMRRPIAVKTYAMQNPYGLGIVDNTLAVCDGTAGTKIFDATVANAIQQKAAITQTKFFDIIIQPNKNAILIGEDGLYQYNLTDINNPIYVSKISIDK